MPGRSDPARRSCGVAAARVATGIAKDWVQSRDDKNDPAGADRDRTALAVGGCRHSPTMAALLVRNPARHARTGMAAGPAG